VEYTVVLDTSKSQRDVEAWIRNWNDSGGGDYRNLEAGPAAGQWTLTLEIADVEKAQACIKYTHDNDDDLHWYTVTPA